MTHIIIKGNPEPKSHNKLYTVMCKCLYKGGVLPNEVDECILWAFGKGAWYVPPSPDWIDRWNKLHPKAFKMRRTDKLALTLQQVGFLFCAQKDARQKK